MDDINKELKLLKLVSQFKGLVLEKGRFRRKVINNKEILTLELGFFDMEGSQKTMVLALDKELTTGDYEKMYERVIR